MARTRPGRTRADGAVRRIPVRVHRDHVLLDVLARIAGHPLLWPQEVTSACFVYGVFVGASVATRRNDHLYLTALTEAMSPGPRRFFEVFNRAVVLLVGLVMVVFGAQNFLTGFGSFRMPSMLPIAYLYAPIPICGALVALFSLEQIVNGLRNGFVDTLLPCGRGRGRGATRTHKRLGPSANPMTACVASPPPPLPQGEGRRKSNAQ